MKRCKKRLLSWLLVLAMMLGMMPSTAYAQLAPPYMSGEKEMIFRSSNLSGAGPSVVSDWASGEYLSLQEEMTDEEGNLPAEMSNAFFKTRLMVRAMHFNDQYEVPISYYIPNNSTGSRHELTLYGVEDVDPADITLEGVTVTGDV